MADNFLDLIETYDNSRADVHTLFDGDGSGVRSAAHRMGRRIGSNEYDRRLIEAAKFVSSIYRGTKPTYLLREALTTSDFPLLFGDIIDRQMLGVYAETAQTYRNYCRISTVPDFRLVNRFAIDGSEGVLLPVAQQEEYPESNLTDTRYQYAVSKYGRRIPFSWEAIMNDDLDGLKDIPRRFGRAARRSEEKFATQLFCDANGPHASLYTVGNKNQINVTNAGPAITGTTYVNNPSLTIAGLQQAFLTLSNQRDKDGEPIDIEMAYLVVPPALRVAAENILNSTEIWLTMANNMNPALVNAAPAGATPGTEMHVMNWMRNALQLVVNTYIPVVASTANGNQSWFLFASPASGRPVLEMGFLRGHETPELYMKDPNNISIGGGDLADPMNGDFDTDSIQYKIRHVFGGMRLDPKMSVASNGANA